MPLTVCDILNAPRRAWHWLLCLPFYGGTRIYYCVSGFSEARLCKWCEGHRR